VNERMIPIVLLTGMVVIPLALLMIGLRPLRGRAYWSAASRYIIFASLGGFTAILILGRGVHLISKLIGKYLELVGKIFGRTIVGPPMRWSEILATIMLWYMGIAAGAWECG
jgi:hypothetical protein